MKKNTLTIRNKPLPVLIHFCGLLTIISFMCILAASPASAAKQSESTLAEVNGETISYSHIQNYIMENHQFLRNKKETDLDYQKILTKLINDKLIIQEAKSIGLGNETWMLNQLEKSKKKIAVQLYLKHNYKAKAKISKKKIKKYFKKNYYKMQLRTLSLKDSLQALGYIKQLRKGKGLDTLAEMFSLDSRKYKGGLHNLKYYADIDTVLRNSCEKLKPGSVIGPIKYKSIYMIIKLEKKIKADMKEFSKFEPKIKKHLTILKNQENWDKYISKLQKKYKLKNHQKNIQNIIKDSANIVSKEFILGSDKPVISWNKTFFISDNDFRNNISRQKMSNQTIPFAEMKKNAEKALSAELVLQVAAYKAGTFDSLAVKNKYSHMSDSLLIEKYIKDMVVDHIKFNKKDFQDYYDLHKDEFRMKSKVLLFEIEVSTRDSIFNIYKRLKKGTSFKFIRSQIISGNNTFANKPQWSSLSMLPDSIGNEIDTMSTDSYTRPFQLSKGWIIFQLKEKKQGEIQALDQVILKIKEIFFQKLFNEKMDVVINTLKKGAKIKTFDNNINKLLNNEP